MEVSSGNTYLKSPTSCGLCSEYSNPNLGTTSRSFGIFSFCECALIRNTVSGLLLTSLLHYS